MKIWIKQATADGSIAMDNGGVANLAYLSSKTRRGRVIGGGQHKPYHYYTRQCRRIDASECR